MEEGDTTMEGQRDVTLLALKMVEGDHEPKKVGGPYNWKRKGNRFSPKVSRKEHNPVNPLILAQ